MFADPQSVTVNAVAKTLARIPTSQPERVGAFISDDGLLELSIRQDKSKTRFRREFRLTQKKIAADPLTAENQEVSASIIFVVDEPVNGFSDTELGYLADAMEAFVDPTSRGKLLQGQI